jgi:PelA/Pel-15E family pectate lyase
MLALSRISPMLIAGMCLFAAAAAAQTAVPWDTAVVHQPPEWYRSTTARAIADAVVQYQSPQGGWPKNTDLTILPRSPADVPRPGDDLANTIDNDATTLPLQFLALVLHATGEAKYRAAFDRGVDYLLAAQYRNGGWPQYFPLRDGYYSRITFNDDAMVRVLVVLRDVGAGRAPYTFVDDTRRARARNAVARGVDLILQTQLRQNGRLTAWCAQYDETTLAPAWARAYEPPSLSGSESVGVVRFLMAINEPSPAIVAAVEGAVAWFRDVALTGMRLEKIQSETQLLVAR